METNWNTIKELSKSYHNLGLSQNLNYDKFFMYSIITHSTAIEGSLLSEGDTQLLFDEGLTANGKPLIHHLMNTDLKNAYEFAIEEAKKKTLVTPELLRAMNSLVMHSTGSYQSMIGGNFDSSKGDFRLCGVQVAGGKSYMNYQKVPGKINDFCKDLNEKLKQISSMDGIYRLSFMAHLNLATIHPWLDGNGRTARLLMNYIQFYHNLVPCKIYREDRAEYLKTLNRSQEEENSIYFNGFMENQLIKTLQEEIKMYEQEQSRQGQNDRGIWNTF